MKVFTIIYIIALLIVLSNASPLQTQITKILTPKVSSEGLLVLDTTLIRFPIDDSLKKKFSLSIINIQTNQTTSLNCFIFQFKDGNKQSRIGCKTINKPIGKYRLVPLIDDINVKINEKIELNIKFSTSFKFSSEFEITNGKETYFYNFEEKSLSFDSPLSKKVLEFNVFERFNDMNLTLVLESDKDNSFEFYCFPSPRQQNYVINCQIYAEKFPQNKGPQKYNVYIYDSLRKKKLNYFVLPVNINLKL